MNIIVNGDKKSYALDSLTISDLLQECKVEMPDMVSVQVNGEFVDRPKFSEHVIVENDEVDFLYFMGGGAQ